MENLRNEILQKIKADTKMEDGIYKNLLIRTILAFELLYIPDSNMFYGFVDFLNKCLIKDYRLFDTVCVYVNDENKVQYFDKKLPETVQFKNVGKLTTATCHEAHETKHFDMTDRYKNILQNVEPQERQLILFEDFISSKDNFTKSSSQNSDTRVAKSTNCDYDTTSYVIVYSSSPFVFYDYLKAIDREFPCILSNYYNSIFLSFYRNAIKDLTVLNYKSYSNEQLRKNENLLTITKVIDAIETTKVHHLSANNMKMLLQYDIFDSNFCAEKMLTNEYLYKYQTDILSHPYTSDKLRLLFEIISRPGAEMISIMFKSDKILRLVKFIIAHKYKNSNVHLISNEYIGPCMTDITKKFINLQTCENYKFEDITVMFDFDLSLIHKTKYLLLPCDQDNHLNEVSAIEQKTETLLTKNRLGKLDNKAHYQFHALFTDRWNPYKLQVNKYLKIIDMDIEKGNIKVDKQFNMSFVGYSIAALANCGLYVNPKHRTNPQVWLRIDTFMLGSIVSYAIFANAYPLQGLKYMLFEKDKMSIFAFGKDISYCVVVDHQSIEDYVFTDKKHHKVRFFLGLKKHVEIHKCEMTSYLTKKWKTIVMQDSITFSLLFTSLTWTRCSIIEAGFAKHRYDTHISIDIENEHCKRQITKMIGLSYKANKNNSKAPRLRYYDLVDKLVSMFSVSNVKVIFTNIAYFVNAAPEKYMFTKNATGEEHERHIGINGLFVNENIGNEDMDPNGGSTTTKTDASSAKDIAQQGDNCVSKVRDEQNLGLSIDQIYQFFSKCSFSDYYLYSCLVSQKQRYLAFRVSNSDLSFIMKQDAKLIVKYLLTNINRRFISISEILQKYKQNAQNSVSHIKTMRQVIITPLSVIYNLPVAFESNRLLREFDYNKFLKISLRDEDGKTLIKDKSLENRNDIYNYYRSILNEGIYIHNNKYFFVAMTTSQLKLHNALFMSPYFSNNILIGSDCVRSWLGDFSSIKNIGKYAMRLGQALSSTIPTVDVKNHLEIDDIKRNEYTFSDGTGIVSLGLAMAIAKELGLNYTPSVFQVRFGGYKGTVVAHPLQSRDIINSKHFCLHDAAFTQKLVERIQCNVANHMLISDDIEQKVKKIKADSIIDSTSMILRKSMNKFVSKHTIVECIAFSGFNPCYLNRQIISLLEGLGINMATFVKLQDDYLLTMIKDIHSNPGRFIRSHFGMMPSMPFMQDTRIFKHLLAKICNRKIKEIFQKGRIHISNGAVLMGSLDELGLLENDEIFVKIAKLNYDTYEDFVEEDSHNVIVGSVVVCKNPCLHPGDIRVVKAVYKKELCYLRNTVVFSQKGDRPVPNMCSGSDLDGDMYTLIWEKSLVPPVVEAPAQYENGIYLSKEIVALKDVVNFYMKYIRNYHVGNIAHAHVAYSDIQGVNSDGAKLLAELFNRSIDFPRTGFVASIPEALMPKAYPDFLQRRGPSYYSYKTLGALFRRAHSLLIDTAFRCDCKSCLLRYINNMNQIPKVIVRGCNAKYNKIVEVTETKDKKTSAANGEYADYLDFCNNFRFDIQGLMQKFGYTDECDFLLHFECDEQDEMNRNIMKHIKRFFTKCKKTLAEKKLSHIRLMIMSERCKSSIMSLPLLLNLHKDKYVIEKQNLFDKPIVSTKRFIYNHSIILQLKTIISNVIESSTGNDMATRHCIDSDKTEKEVTDCPLSQTYSDDCKDPHTIIAHADKLIYNKFMNNISRDLDDEFSEIFALLYIADIFCANSFDLVSIFFLYLQSKMKTKTRLDIYTAMLEISRDFYKQPDGSPFRYFVMRKRVLKTKTLYAIQCTDYTYIEHSYNDNDTEVLAEIDRIARNISLVGYLFMIDIHLVQKCFCIKKDTVRSATNVKPDAARQRKHGYTCVVIKGMFDEHDELRLEEYNDVQSAIHRKCKVYVPQLLNKGYCDIENHKAYIKEFFINVYFDCIRPRLSSTQDIDAIKRTTSHCPDGMEADDKHLLTIIISPGVFYIHDVANACVNEILTIDSLKASLQFYKMADRVKTNMKGYFYNHSRLMNPTHRDAFILEKKLKYKCKEYSRTLALICKNTRYQVYYRHDGSKYVLDCITKGRTTLGKAYILNVEDACMEIIYEEIIYKGGYSNMSKYEDEMFSRNLISENANTFVISSHLSDFTEYRLEVDVAIMNKNGYSLDIINRRVYTSKDNNRILCRYSDRIVVNSQVVRSGTSIKTIPEYIETFETIWSIFRLFYNT